jgi:hypothetical protein
VKLRPGDVLAGAGSVLLLGATFLRWYSDSESLSAWAAFGVVDVILAAVVVLGLALAASQLAAHGPAVPVGLAVLTATVGTIAALLVLYRILNQPGPNDVVRVCAGAWLGLAAVAAVTAGAWWALDDERPRPADPPPPEVERRPAPPRT